MNERRFRVLLAEGPTGQAARSLLALYPEPDSQLELSVVSTLPTLLATIELAEPEAIFLDLSLGWPDSMDAVRRVHRAAPSIPLIVLADTPEESFASRSISEGAMDTILKGFMNRQTIERVLRAALERNTLEGLADLLRDPLTGLYNREGFTTLGARSMDTALRAGGTLVLLCAGIQNYSSLREEWGKPGSEQTLRDAAALLKSCFRRSDFIARLGEAQFAALAVDAAEPSAQVLRQRVESRLAIYNQNSRPWGPLLLRLSVGYWGAHDSRSFTEFLDKVEAELRQPELAITGAAARRQGTLERR